VIAHYQTAHTIAPNISADIRYCIYFRVTHSCRKDKTYRPDAMTNVWIEFEGLRSVLGIPLQKALPPVPNTAAAAPAMPALTPEYAAAMALLTEAQKERDAGNLKIALAMYERGIGAALSARGGLSNEARAATGDRLEECLTAAEDIKEKLKAQAKK